MLGIGRTDIVRAIKTGDVDQLRGILEEKPSLLEEKFVCKLYGPKPLLHMAAAYNQPEIVKFLVNEKGAKTSDWCGGPPLHYAASAKSYEAAKALLDLGADPDQKFVNRSCYENCTNKKIKELMRSVRQERQERVRQRSEAAQQAAEQARAKAEREAAARVAGKWTLAPSGEVVLERDYPGQKLRLIDIFDVAAECRKSITKDLETGHVSPPKEECFSEIPDKEMIEQARAQLAQANDDALAAESRKPEHKRLIIAGIRS